MVADTENIQRLRTYLNFKTRIQISDGRTFIGVFMCVDKDKNIILAHAEEFRGGDCNIILDSIQYHIYSFKCGLFFGLYFSFFKYIYIAYYYLLDEKRLVGLVMIPGKHLVKVEAENMNADDLYS
ncbi:hypothetical protein J3Q64DRAFT_1714310 [Phycomyces blakesleeanus]|uniref:Sm domain-containing protein n=1 Tax=Phycomyces blakesleeanus TaxID=4837 RepID=A0ABR3BGT3_PHYBL